MKIALLILAGWMVFGAVGAVIAYLVMAMH